MSGAPESLVAVPSPWWRFPLPGGGSLKVRGLVYQISEVLEQLGSERRAGLTV